MKKLMIITSTLALVAAVGCMREGGSTELAKKADQILEELKVVKTDIAALKAGAGARRPTPPRRGPQPGVTYSVPVEGRPFRGKADAPVAVVKAYEFACPACRGARPFVDEIVKQYGDRVKMVYKSFVVHPQTAYPAAYAACAADKQGKFKKMEEVIWDKGFSAKPRKLSEADMEGFAKEVGLNIAKYKKDYAGVCKTQVTEDQKHMGAIGTSGTPTFYVNGKVVQRRSIAEIGKMIEAAEKEAKAKIAAGTPAKSYYKTWIAEKGKKSK